jgi:hypothetical protein
MTKYTDQLWRDLVQEHGPALAHADRPEPGRARGPRVLAGSTLALAGVGVGLTVALSGTSALPALAVTRQQDGSVLVTVNVKSTAPWVLPADRKLAAMGIDEQILISTLPGPATVKGAVSCTALGGVNTPPGPQVKVLMEPGGTQVIPSGNTGAGTGHLGCVYFKTPTQSGAGNTGTG